MVYQSAPRGPQFTQGQECSTGTATQDEDTAFKVKIQAGGLDFIVQHELWDANIQDHADQGVAILVVGQVDGQETTILRFNCFDIERSYIYGPEGKNRRWLMDPTVDGDPIDWTMKQLHDNLPIMLKEAGYESIVNQINLGSVRQKLGEVGTTAHEMSINARRTVGYNRGTVISDIFEAGNIRFGLELRAVGSGGLPIHVFADLPVTPGKEHLEETVLLSFDCIRERPHYHYGPMNKNYRVVWDQTLVPDPVEWTLQQFKDGKLGPMIERAGYPEVASELNQDLISAVIPAMEARAREMQPKERV